MQFADFQEKVFAEACKRLPEERTRTTLGIKYRMTKAREVALRVIYGDAVPMLQRLYSMLIRELDSGVANGTKSTG